MQAHLAGRAYADPEGTRANLYLIALGETGVGKDAPLAAPPPARLVDAARMHAERWRNAAGSDRPEPIVAEETPEAKCVFRSTADTLMLPWAAECGRRNAARLESAPDRAGVLPASRQRSVGNITCR